MKTKREILAGKMVEFTDFLENICKDNDEDGKKMAVINKMKGEKLENLVSSLVSSGIPPKTIAALIASNAGITDDVNKSKIDEYVQTFFDILNA